MTPNAKSVTLNSGNEPKREALVNVSIEHLTKVIDRLGDELNTLIQRIRPVSNDEDRKECTGNEVRNTINVEIAEQIALISDRVDVMINHTNDAIQRLEI